MMENVNVFFSLDHSYNHTWHVTNVVMYCDTRTDVHTYTQTHTYKKMYICIIIETLILVMIGRINDFTIINLVHMNQIYYRKIVDSS